MFWLRNGRTKGRDGFFSDERSEANYSPSVAKEYQFRRFHEAFLDLLSPEGGVALPHSWFIKKWNEIFSIVSLAAFAIDPVFFFVVYVDPDYACLQYDWKFSTTLIVARFLCDVVFYFHIFLEFRTAFVEEGEDSTFLFLPWLTSSRRASNLDIGDINVDRRAIARRYAYGWLAWDIIAALPLPQAVIIGVHYANSQGATSSSEVRSVLQFVILLQNIPRFIRFLPYLTGSYRANGFLFESSSARFLLNLVAYAMGSHLFGCLWYLFGLSRISSCLTETCSKESALQPPCQSNYLNCEFAYRNTTEYFAWSLITSTNTNCVNTSTVSSGPFRYGIYGYVLPIATTNVGITKYMVSLFWGFQQLTSLGLGNYFPSNYIPEILFGIVVIVVGLLLFSLLIGNIQSFLTSLTERTFQYQVRQRDLRSWMKRHKVPKFLERKVIEYERLTWATFRGVSNSEILDPLPEDLRKELTRHLCGSLILKSDLLREISSKVVDELCLRMKKEAYMPLTVLCKQGDPISRMHFVVRGELASEKAAGFYTAVTERHTIVKGGFFGDELLLHVLESMASLPSMPSLAGSYSRAYGRGAGVRENAFPLSERTVTCETDVEAFVLESSDLLAVCQLYPAEFQGAKMQRALNCYSVHRQNHAAKTIQVRWRHFVWKKYNLRLYDMVMAKRQGKFASLVQAARDQEFLNANFG